jgi:hypothetical protein
LIGGSLESLDFGDAFEFFIDSLRLVKRFEVYQTAVTQIY